MQHFFSRWGRRDGGSGRGLNKTIGAGTGRAVRHHAPVRKVRPRSQAPSGDSSLDCYSFRAERRETLGYFICIDEIPAIQDLRQYIE